VKAITAWIRDRVEWFMATRLGRTFTRYNDHRGELLANGLSFSAIFSIFAGLYIIFALLGIWLQGNPVLLDSLIDQLNAAAPGLIDTGDGGAIPLEALLSTTILGWSGAVAVITLLFTALGWIDAIRGGVRLMFELPGLARNPILGPVIDLGLAALFGLLVLVSAAITLLASTGIEAVVDYLNQADETATVASRGIGLFLALVVNTLTMVIILKLVARIPGPVGPLLIGALIGGLGLTALQALGTFLLGGARANPLLASFAVIVGLMIWFALISRVILYTAAWLAVAEVPEPASGRATERVVGTD
jgi:membrane protein